MNRFSVNIIRGLILLLSKLPLSWLYGMGSVFSWLACNLLQYRKTIVLTNIARSFPEKKSWEVDAVVKDFYRHLGDMVAEAVWFAGSDRKRIRDQKICSVKNPEVLAGAYDGADGVVVLDTHCGNWEILGGFCVYNYSEEHPYPFTEDDMYVVYKKQTSEVMDEVLKRNRKHFLSDYKGLVEASGLLRLMVMNKGRKALYLCNSDQYPYVSNFDLGLFMNQRTIAMKGAVAVAHKMGMPVLYMRMVHKCRGKYEISFVKLCDNAAEYAPEEVVRMYYDELEKEIRETPHNWLWSHNRWK